MSNPEHNFDKKSLLALATKIIGASQGTLNVLCGTPICNLKTVQRNAKNTKDPAPLQSMIATISTKYPISVDAAKAKRLKIPSQYLDRNDNHQYGRRRCSLEAITWYLDNVATPNDEIKAAIDVLFRGKRKEVADHYAIDWLSARIRFGRTLLNRQLVETQEVVFNVPQNQKTDYLMAAVMPHLTIIYPHLDKTIIRDLRMLETLSSTAKLTLQSQLRLLLDFMDPKPRYMPALPDYPMAVNKVRYVYASAHHLVQVSRAAVQAQGSYHQIIQSVGQMVWYLLHDGHRPNDINAKLSCATFRSVPFQLILDAEQDRSSMYPKLLFAVMGRAVDIEKKIRGFSFLPFSGTTEQEMTKNRAGVNFARYIGTEKLQIMGPGFIAHVTRVDDMYTRVVLQQCDVEDFKKAMAALHVYLKRGFQESWKRSIRAMTEEIYNYVIRNIHQALDLRPSELRDMFSTYTSTDRFVFEEYIEPLPKLRRQASVDRTTINIVGQQGFQVTRPRTYPLLPIDFRVDASMFADFLAPPRRLLRKIQFYCAPGNFAVLMRHITENNYNWRNDCIREGVNETQRVSVASTSRAILQSLRDHQELRAAIAFYYCFSGHPTRLYGEVGEDVNFLWFGSHPINLSLSRGDVQVVNGVFTVMGQPADVVKEETYFEALPVLLPGFKLLLDYQGPSRVMSYQRAFELSKQMKPGSIIKVFMFGKDLILERSDRHLLDVTRTINTRMHSHTMPLALEGLVNLSKRIHDEADLSQIPVKRVREEEGFEMEAVMEEDQDSMEEYDDSDWV